MGIATARDVVSLASIFSKNLYTNQNELNPLEVKSPAIRSCIVLVRLYIENISRFGGSADFIPKQGLMNTFVHAYN